MTGTGRTAADLGGTDACPHSEVLAAFVDGRLDGDRRAQVEDHVSRCEACYDVVKETLRTLAEMDEGARGGGSGGVLPFIRRPALRIVLPIAAALVIGLGTAALWRSPDAYAEAVRPLVQAMGERRFFDARLTGGFQYARVAAPLRSGGAAPSVPWEVYAAADSLKRRSESARTPEAERALAAAYLVTGDLDQGVAVLERLAGESPSDASVLSDLSAAYLTRARAKGTASDLGSALDAAARATRAAPDLPEALFNHALALDALGMRSEADALWRELATRQAGTGWGEEAAERLKATAPGTSRGPEPRSGAGGGVDWMAARGRLEEEIPYRWAAAMTADPPASIDLGEARALAEGLLQRSGETFHRELVAELEAVSKTGGARMAAAFLALQRAESAAGQDRWQESYEAALEARAASAAGSPAAWLGAVRTGNALYYLSRLSEAEEVLDDVVRRCPQRYLAPRARAQWLLGLVRFTRQRPYEALQAHEEARRLYEVLGERPHAVFLRGLIAQDLFALGHEERGWREWVAAMLELESVPLSPRRQFSILWEAARRLLHDRSAASLALLNRSVEQSRTTSDVPLLMAALVRRARAALRCGEIEMARADAEEARTLQARVSQELRGRWARDLDLLTHEMQARASGLAAVELQAIADAMAGEGNEFETVDVRELAARELERAGRREEAAEELERILDVGDRAARAIDDAVDAALFRRRLADLRLSLARLRLETGQPWEAFLALEGALHRDEPTENRIEKVRALLPADTTLIRFMATSRGLYRWSVRPDGMESALEGSMDVARAAVRVLRTEIRRPARHVYVAPAGALRMLPWGRLFAEAEAPGPPDGASLSLAAEGPSRRDERGSTLVRVAILATPESIGNGGSRLPELPEVVHELHMLQDLYAPGSAACRRAPRRTSAACWMAPTSCTSPATRWWTRSMPRGRHCSSATAMGRGSRSTPPTWRASAGAGRRAWWS